MYCFRFPSLQKARSSTGCCRSMRITFSTCSSTDGARRGAGNGICASPSNQRLMPVAASAIVEPASPSTCHGAAMPY